MGDTTFIPSGGDLDEASDKTFSWEAVAGDLGASLHSLNLGHLATGGAVERGLGDDPALVWYGADGTTVRQTYTEMDEASARAAQAFLEAGLAPGDRVLFILPCIPELFHGFHGVLRAGGVVSIVPAGRNPDGIRHAMAEAAPRFIVGPPAMKNVIASLRPAMPQLERVFYVNRTSFTLPSLADYETIWADAVGSMNPQTPVVPMDPGAHAVLHFSDMSPQAAVISHQAALGLAASASVVLGWKPREAIVVVLVPGEAAFEPYLLLAPFLAGTLLICHEDPARFTRHADIAAELSPRGWFSSFKALDVMIRTDPNLGTLLKGCSHIGVIHPADVSFLTMSSLSWGAPVRTVWMPWEMGVAQATDRSQKIGSAGKPVPGSDVRIITDSGSAATAGESGIIALRLGPGAPFVEYWGDVNLTMGRVREGWFLSPQRGHFDQDGCLWLD